MRKKEIMRIANQINNSGIGVEIEIENVHEKEFAYLPKVERDGLYLATIIYNDWIKRFEKHIIEEKEDLFILKPKALLKKYRDYHTSGYFISKENSELLIVNIHDLYAVDEKEGLKNFFSKPIEKAKLSLEFRILFDKLIDTEVLLNLYSREFFREFERHFGSLTDEEKEEIIDNEELQLKKFSKNLKYGLTTLEVNLLSYSLYSNLRLSVEDTEINLGVYLEEHERMANCKLLIRFNNIAEATLTNIERLI